MTIKGSFTEMAQVLSVQVQVHRPTLAMQMKLNKIHESWLS